MTVAPGTGFLKLLARTGFPACASLCLLLLGCGRKQNPRRASEVTIQVKGSDTMVNLAQAWAEEFCRLNPIIDIEISGGGSGVGIAALTRGSVDMANASRNMKQQEIEQARAHTGKDPAEFVVGHDAIAIYVHRDNPIQEITVEQLAEIFRENGSITRWSQLGITMPGKNDEIVRISRQSSSGTYEFFRTKVLKKQDFKLGSRDMNGSKEVVELVGGTRLAIGYSGMGYATDHVKMLPVAFTPGETAVPPTMENTQAHTYPLARSLLVYTLGQPQGALKKYIDWITSDAGQEIVEINGYVPLAAHERSSG